MRGWSGGDGQTGKDFSDATRDCVAHDASNTAASADKIDFVGRFFFTLKIPSHPQKNIIPFARFGGVLLILKFVAEAQLQFADKPVEVAARNN